MNVELIDLYRGVQHRRGEWKPFDPVLYKGQPGTITDKSEGQVEIFTPESKGGYYQWVMANDPDLLWLPPVWSDDERCLIGMIGWCDIFKYEEPDGQPRYTVWHRGCHFQATTLPEALLRAIREQEGDHE